MVRAADVVWRPAERPSIERRVLAALQRHGVLTSPELARLVGAPSASVTTAGYRLRAKGLVESVRSSGPLAWCATAT